MPDQRNAMSMADRREHEQIRTMNVYQCFQLTGAFARFDSRFSTEMFLRNYLLSPRFSASRRYQSVRRDISCTTLSLPVLKCERKLHNAAIAGSNKAAQLRKHGIIGSHRALSGDLVILSDHDDVVPSDAWKAKK